MKFRLIKTYKHGSKPISADIFGKSHIIFLCMYKNNVQRNETYLIISIRSGVTDEMAIATPGISIKIRLFLLP